MASRQEGQGAAHHWASGGGREGGREGGEGVGEGDCRSVGIGGGGTGVKAPLNIPYSSR